ncbi:MAG TPA: nucleotidyltransferase family protein [Thermoanaerobaculia bacterium]|jgi:predicted nucleotidyltransferase|nr:nucleotidyltransferase family protein [Thermoanaerobaculia bacterium]
MPQARTLAIPVPHEEIAAFCRKWGIKRLAFFGSVVRDDFGPESDVDVLVEFGEGRTPGWEFFGTIPDELSAIFGGRPVDLMTRDSLSNWMKREVAATEVAVYAEEQ